MLLKDRNAVVYGASGAVGAAVARAFAREGARVFLAARQRDRLDVVADDIRLQGGMAEPLPVDATDKHAIEAQLALISGKAGPVKIMFNAIDWGDTQGEPLGTMSLEKVLRPVQTGLTTWFYTGTVVADHMVRHGGGSIVGISANAGRQAFPNVGGFGIACAAVEHFLRQLAVENGPFGVRVNWVRSPGSPDSPGVHEV
ncbi:NADP-dependent 3-hydroxy acid dehydrogenase YdfG [Rhizobium azibense]|nr:NADP-dependent 3-hydroxy acid dehydrogenase YdfG [Rhizobium azibense]